MAVTTKSHELVRSNRALDFASRVAGTFCRRNGWRRGADVTPELRWIPIVTMLQVMADMRGGDITPHGHGHNFAADDYIDAWLALTEPAGWTEPEIGRLKALFATRGGKPEP